MFDVIFALVLSHSIMRKDLFLKPRICKTNTPNKRMLSKFFLNNKHLMNLV